MNSYTTNYSANNSNLSEKLTNSVQLIANERYIKVTIRKKSQKNYNRFLKKIMTMNVRKYVEKVEKHCGLIEKKKKCPQIVFWPKVKYFRAVFEIVVQYFWENRKITIAKKLNL